MDAHTVEAAVRRRYHTSNSPSQEWAVLDEMDLQPGYSSRRIDLLCVRMWRYEKAGVVAHERHAVEIKVSRADLRAELADPRKAAAWQQVVHRFWLAVPAELSLDDLEIPTAWGILRVHASGTCRRARDAELTEPDPLPGGVLLEALRRADTAEARLRTADDQDLPAQLAAAQAQIAKAERSLMTVRNANRRLTARANNALAVLFEVVPGAPCRCGRRLKSPPPRQAFGRGTQLKLREHLDDATAWADELDDCPYPGVIDIPQMARDVAEHLGHDDDGRPLTLRDLTDLEDPA